MHHWVGEGHSLIAVIGPTSTLSPRYFIYVKEPIICLYTSSTFSWSRGVLETRAHRVMVQTPKSKCSLFGAFLIKPLFVVVVIGKYGWFI